jgi:chaperone required for assembly of F1-ATPase
MTPPALSRTLARELATCSNRRSGVKRTYSRVAATQTDESWQVHLDDKPVLTPARRTLAMPNRALASAIAEEWHAQSDSIVPMTMPLTRLAITGLDWVAPNREQVVGRVAGYAEFDLLCYRAERPQELVARQLAVWQPLVDWATLRYDAPFAVTSGVMPRSQPPEVLAAIHSAIESYSVLPLAALHDATTACGSVVLGLALMAGWIDSDTAWHASQLDEKFQTERWGEDAEAARRAATLRADIDTSARFFQLLSQVD